MTKINKISKTNICGGAKAKPWYSKGSTYMGVAAIGASISSLIENISGIMVSDILKSKGYTRGTNFAWNNARFRLGPNVYNSSVYF